MAKTKTDAPTLTVEQAVEAARAKRAAEAAAPATDPVAEFLATPPEPVAPAPEPSNEDLEKELDTQFNALFTPNAPVDTEVKLDPDGVLSFNLEALPTTATTGPLVLADDPHLPPMEELLPVSDFEPEQTVDWDRLSDATRLEIAAGRAALAKHGNPAR